MRPLLFVAAALALASCLRAETLAFQQGSWLCIAEADGTKVRKIVKGVCPDISTDGTRIAFNTEDADGQRHIAFVDVASKKVTLVPNIPSDNCFGPVWSPDGQRLAFSIFLENKWFLARIAADGTDLKIFRGDSPKADELWVPCWAADGKTLFCHGLEEVFQLDLDGKTLQKWPISEISPKGGMNSGSNLSATADGKSLIVDLDMDENFERKDWDGPPPAVWSFDLESGKGRRLSPPGTFEWSPRATPFGGILCLGLPKGTTKPAIYQLSGVGAQRTLLLRDASSPSLSR
ncbi:hypothetical protein BH09VER1_BH09VER1_05920 [soil metagenome]